MKSLITLFGVAWIAGLFLSPAFAGSFPTVDGGVINGDVYAVKDEGVMIKSPDGTYLPKQTWDKFTQDGLKALLPEGKSAADRAIIESLIDDPPKTARAPKEIVVKPVAFPPRPSREHLGFLAMFSSPLGLMMILVLYAATILAGYEVAIYKDQPIGMVCGLAAIPVAGVLSPVAFFFLKTRPPAPEPFHAGPAPRLMSDRSAPAVITSDLAGASPAPVSSVLAAPAPVASQLAAPQSLAKAVGLAPEARPAQNLPAPVVFSRQDFSFNRRFFETKMVNFLKLVPSTSDKDLVLWIKSARGEFTGRRITQITPADLRLQVFKGGATADETIPFVEIFEVQIRHKDFAA